MITGHPVISKTGANIKKMSGIVQQILCLKIQAVLMSSKTSARKVTDFTEQF